jgi:hypothetical protein
MLESRLPVAVPFFETRRTSRVGLLDTRGGALLDTRELVSVAAS